MKEAPQEDQTLSSSSYKERYVGLFARIVVDTAYGLKTSPNYKATKHFFYNLLENHAYPYKRYFDLMMMVLIF